MMQKHSHCGQKMVSKILLVIGGLNWGLIGIGGFIGKDWNVVHAVLGSWSAVEWIVYILVGVAAIVSLCRCGCKKCGSCQMCQAGAPEMKDEKMM